MGNELLELVHLGLCLGEYEALFVLELLILISQLVDLLCLAFQSLLVLLQLGIPLELTYLVLESLVFSLFVLFLAQVLELLNLIVQMNLQVLLLVFEL